jgi:pimeloyl-ACP methyl ester carboxylesterase
LKRLAAPLDRQDEDMTTLEQSIETRSVLAEPFQTDVIVRGEGPAVVYLHSQYGLRWDSYLEALSKSFTVYAPQVAGHESTLEKLDDMLDLLTYLNDVLDALDLGRTHVVGHSLGAALAAELAAINPNRVDRMVLLSPLGIWSESDPVEDMVGEFPATRASRLYADAQGDGAQQWLKNLVSPDRVYFRAMRAYSHWYWPFPDAGLHKRAHRITAPTLVVRGDADGFTSARYTSTLADLIAGSSVSSVPGASHMLSEHPDEAARMTIEHLQKS